MVAELIMSDANRHGRVGVRIHDIRPSRLAAGHRDHRRRPGQRLAFVTLPKGQWWRDVRIQLDALRRAAAAAGLERTIPLHVLIETYGACGMSGRSPPCPRSNRWISA
jgi:citrate lyase subunit beta/citryl-CoA lyase